MSSNKVFKIAFLISALTHGVMLFANPGLPFFGPGKKHLSLKVNYIKALQEIKSPLKITPPKKKASPRYPPLPGMLKEDLPAPPPFIDKEPPFKKSAKIPSREPGFSKPAFMKPDTFSVKKIITLPAVETEKITNPSYLNYYQFVREKIRRAAYQNYGRSQEGEVYLSFIVLKEGSLKDVRLVEQKSSLNPYLRGVALKSIKDASPFPVFPRDLDYPQLSFNVIISFQIE